MHGDAAEELRIKIGGLLRHDFSRGGNFHDLVDSAGIQEEGDLGAAGVYGVESGGGFTLVSEMSLSGNRLRSDSEGGLEDSFVKKNHVEFALERRDVGEKLREIDAVAKRKDVKGTFCR